MTLPNLVDGQTYSVCCQAENRIGLSQQSECFEFKAGTVPCKPTGVKTTNSYNAETVAITWDQYSAQCTGGWSINGCTVAINGYMNYDTNTFNFNNDLSGFNDITSHCAETYNTNWNQQNVQQFYYTHPNGQVLPVTNWDDVPRYYLDA